jgi:hypothetical protein
MRQFFGGALPSKDLTFSLIEGAFFLKIPNVNLAELVPLKDLSRFEMIVSLTILGIILSDTGAKYDSSHVSDIVKTCMDFVKGRAKGWNFHLIISVMSMFQKTRAHGHLDALKLAQKVLQQRDILDAGLIARIIQLCYYSDATDDEFVKQIETLLENKNASEEEFYKEFSKKAKEIASSGKRFNYIQNCEWNYNNGCVVQ